MTLVTYGPLLLKGALITLGTWILAATVSLLIGTIFGVLSCRQLGLTHWQIVIRAYTFVAKGVPAYVQILIAYFVIPAALGINLSGFWAATLALAFCSSGYVTEIVRAGINGVARGQWEACFVLGYPFPATLRLVILPQAFKNILPAFFGELEQLLKSTALLATIGVTELTRTGMNIISRELNPIAVYLVIAAIYLLFAALLQIVAFYLEKRGVKC